MLRCDYYFRALGLLVCWCPNAHRNGTLVVWWIYTFQCSILYLKFPGAERSMSHFDLGFSKRFAYRWHSIRERMKADGAQRRTDGFFVDASTLELPRQFILSKSVNVMSIQVDKTNFWFVIMKYKYISNASYCFLVFWLFCPQHRK